MSMFSGLIYSTASFYLCWHVMNSRKRGYFSLVDDVLPKKMKLLIFSPEKKENDPGPTLAAPTDAW